jgi:NTE family protein
MSITVFFSLLTYREHILVDGAVLPEGAFFKDWAGNLTRVICFRLKSDHVTAQKFKKSWLPLSQYVNMFWLAFMTAVSKEYIRDNY